MLALVLIVVLVLLLVGSLPQMPYTRGYYEGYYPAGGILTILVIVIIVLLLTGHL